MVVADELILKVRADTKAAQAQMGALAKSTNAAATSMVTSFAKVTLAAAKMATGLGLAIGVTSVMAFANFDEAMTNSLAIMGDVSDTMRNDMETAARAVAKTTTISATEAAEAYFFLASAGMSAEQSIAALPAVAAFAQAGNFDMSTATDLATDALSAMGMASDDTTENLDNLVKMTDVLVKGNTLANTSVEQLSEALVTKSAAAARTLGMTLEETSAILLVMADAGIKGTNAGTQLAMTLNNLTSNAIKNEDAFADLGIAVFDAEGAMRPFHEIVGDMSVAFADMSDEQKVAAISALGFGDKAAGLIKTLLGTEGALEDYLGELQNASGYTDSVAAKQLESFTAQWDILKSKFIDIGLTIGSVLVPILIELFDYISPYVEKAAEWIEANDEVAVSFGAIATALWPVLKVVGFLASPIGLVVAAIGAVVFWLWKMGVTWQDVVDLMAGLWESTLKPMWEDFEAFITEVVEKVTSWIDDNWDEIMAIVEEGIQFVIDLWEELWSVLEPLVQKLVDFINEEVGELIEWFQDNWPKIKEVVLRILRIVQDHWMRIWGTIKQFIGPIFDAILRIIGGALDIIKGIISTVLSIITADWSGAWEGIKQIVEGAWNVINGIVDLAWQQLQMGWDMAIAALRLAWETFWAVLGDAVKSAFNGAVNVVKGGVNAVIGGLESGINATIDLINAAIKAYNSIPLAPDIGLVPKVSMPRVAEGGMLTKSGPVRVGERGTEIVNLPAGSTVKPLQGGGAGVGAGIVIEKMYGGDPKAMAMEIGWEFTKRGIA